LGPLLERLFPGEVEQGRMGAEGGGLQWCHGSIFPLGGHRRPSWAVQTVPAGPNGIIAGPDGGRNGDGRPAGARRPSPGRAGSAAQALTGLDVEEVHVALLRTEVDRLSLRRRTPAVDTSDERLGDLVRSGAAAMDVGVGTELLDQIDLDRDALFVRDELEVLGAHAQGHG